MPTANQTITAEQIIARRELPARQFKRAVLALLGRAVRASGYVKARFADKLADHTSLGFSSFSEEMAWRVDLLRDGSGEPFTMVFIDAPLGDMERWPIIAVLYACAGLTSYQELVDEWCIGIGDQASEQIDGEG